MEILVNFLALENTFTVILGYQISYVEVIGIVTGLASVIFASRLNRLTWSLGVINEIAFAILFYQVQLYAAVLLQGFLLVITLYGWVTWHSGAHAEQPPHLISTAERVNTIIIVIISTALIALLSSRAHILFPTLIPKPAFFPLEDAFTAAASIVATILLARKTIESWALWIVIDIVSVSLYVSRGIPFLALLYGVFFFLAVRGLREWQKQMVGGYRV